MSVRSVDELHFLDQYREADKVGHLYDTDDLFAGFIRKTIPDFSYMDYQDMAVSQVKILLKNQR